MTREQFKEFTEKMNTAAVARGLKDRETTEEWIDMAWPCFNGYTEDEDGVSKDDLLFVLG